MKTNDILIILALSFCLNATAQMANSTVGDDPWNNLQNTFNDFFAGDSDNLAKLTRWYWLTKNDIRMWLYAKNETDRTPYTIAPGFGLVVTNFEHEGSIYAEFDWDNKALMMIGHTTSYNTNYLLSPVGTETINNPEETIVQYTDKDGYWYVPYDDPNKKVEYLKFNAKQMAVDIVDILKDAKALLEDRIVQSIIGLLNLIDLDNINTENLFNDSLLASLIPLLTEDNWYLAVKTGEPTKEMIIKLEETIKELLNKENAELAGFPVFIHWALMYSPDVIRAKIKDLKEEKYACYDSQPDNMCTKLIIASGPDKGKFMIFDKYDRLVYISSGKEGTVEFSYDADLTVNLPAAQDMSEMMNKFIKQEQTKRENDEILDSIKKEKEKLERENAQKEEILDWVKEKIRELEVKKEQAITKKDRDEYQEIIDELKDILKKESN